SSSIPIPDSNPDGSGGNHGGQLSSDRSVSRNEDGLTLQSVYDLCVNRSQLKLQQLKIRNLRSSILKSRPDLLSITAKLGLGLLG
ncbi:hypothetical protein Tco_1446078, partial [Tanacetum coccineum]